MDDLFTQTYTRLFIESVKATYPYYVIRLAGGALYFGGMVIMAYNMVKTIASGKPVEAPIPALPAESSHAAAHA